MEEKKRDSLSQKLLIGEILRDFVDLNYRTMDSTISVCQYVATISGIILTVSLSSMISPSFETYDAFVKFALITLIGTSLFSIIISLVVVEPSFSKDKESKFHITLDLLPEEKRTEKEFFYCLKQLTENKEYALRSYSSRIKDLTENNVRRTLMLRSAITILLIGLAFAGSLIVVSSFIRTIG